MCKINLNITRAACVLMMTLAGLASQPGALGDVTDRYSDQEPPKLRDVTQQACCGLLPDDRVELLVDNPDGAVGLFTGACGTVLCCDSDNPLRPIMVSWDGWSNGYNEDSFCDKPPGSYPADSGWWMQCSAITLGCGVCPSEGDCFQEHPTPGCQHEECCIRVCEVYPECCMVQWGGACVNIAVELCIVGCLAPDSNEPDNSPADATPIADGQTQSHTIHYYSDVDWLVITLQAGCELTVETSNLSGSNADTVLELYDDTCNFLAENDDCVGLESCLTWTATYSGIHYIKVRTYGGSSEYCDDQGGGPADCCYDITATVDICGDPDHPYPIGDLNKDCRVDVPDFAIFAAHWLECTAPECD